MEMDPKRFTEQIKRQRLAESLALGRQAYAWRNFALRIGLPCSLPLIGLGGYLMGWGVEDFLEWRGLAYTAFGISVLILIGYVYGLAEYDQMHGPPD